MTIRRILLLAFLLVSLAPASVLTLAAFNRTRAVMQAQIEQGVLRSASATSADIDKFLFERLLNATTWTHLEVMQDLRLGDVDKRLSRFLGEMKIRHGTVYHELLAVDPQGRVVAGSDPARIGRTLPEPEPWVATTLPGGRVSVDAPAASDDAQSAPLLRLRCAIDSQFTEGSIGELVLEVEGRRIEALLDQAADPALQLLLLDQDHRVLALSAALRDRGIALRSTFPESTANKQTSGVHLLEGPPLFSSPVILGFQRSRGAGNFTGFGWQTLALESREVALAPVHRMAWVFAGLLAATALVTVLVTLSVAARIARPVVALTEFTRSYLRPGDPPPPPPEGPGELGELNRSFVRLVQDLQRSQQTLVQASKLAAVGEVTALMAHEVRTPLGILRSSVQMLRSEPSLSAEGAELLKIVETETARLNRLVGSMLDSARTREPQFHPQDVHALIAHAVALLGAQARDCGVAIQIHPEAQRFTADCDAEQLTQVLLNLVMNALQVLHRGGHIELRTRNEGERLLIEVGDDGPGISMQERGRIFEPFVFKREGGLGLGLAVVRQILRSHGGEVSADASPLGGALFRVWFPLRQTPHP